MPLHPSGHAAWVSQDYLFLLLVFFAAVDCALAAKLPFETLPLFWRAVADWIRTAASCVNGVREVLDFFDMISPFLESVVRIGNEVKCRLKVWGWSSAPVVKNFQELR